ncbi:MAG: hypothetical protein IBX69_05685 [Anaerolineales bacterium]|nr:hypothetical protein [Anaerolineales bacterium]
MNRHSTLLTMHRLPEELESRCPFYSEDKAGEGVERYGKRLLRSWNADFYRTPPH